MTLPYGTMTDEEMKGMRLADLQDDGGLLFLWVTGRAVRAAPGDSPSSSSNCYSDRTWPGMSQGLGVSMLYSFE